MFFLSEKKTRGNSLEFPAVAKLFTYFLINFLMKKLILDMNFDLQINNCYNKNTAYSKVKEKALAVYKTIPTIF